MKLSPRIKDLLDLIDPPKGFEPWHGGPSLMGCLRNVNAEQAGWKPTPERNSIWDLTLHMAYWDYTIIRKLNPESPKGFERGPSNFPRVPEDHSEESWKEDKDLLKKTHEILVDEIKNFPSGKLDEISPTKKEWTYSQLIVGIAAHETYHIGQIQVLKKLFRELKKDSNSH